MKRESSSWDTYSPYQGVTKRQLPLLSIQYEDDGFWLRTGPWPNRTDIQELTLRGLVENGAVVFKEMTILSPSMTVDTPRLPIGDLRAVVATWLKRDPEGIDVRTWITPGDIEGDWSEFKGAASHGRAAAVKASGEIRSTGRLPGRPPLTNELLRLVAEVYIEEFPRSSRRINKAVTEKLRQELDQPDLKVSTVKNWVGRSRGDDWLADTSGGQPNGSPGPKLLEIRRKESHDET